MCARAFACFLPIYKYGSTSVIRAVSISSLTTSGVVGLYSKGGCVYSGLTHREEKSV